MSRLLHWLQKIREKKWNSCQTCRRKENKGKEVEQLLDLPQERIKELNQLLGTARKKRGTEPVTYYVVPSPTQVPPVATVPPAALVPPVAPMFEYTSLPPIPGFSKAISWDYGTNDRQIHVFVSMWIVITSQSNTCVLKINNVMYPVQFLLWSWLFEEVSSWPAKYSINGSDQMWRAFDVRVRNSWENEMIHRLSTNCPCLLFTSSLQHMYIMIQYEVIHKCTF